MDVKGPAAAGVTTHPLRSDRERALFAKPQAVETEYGPLRLGIERGMVLTLAIASILLTVSTVPYFGFGTFGPGFTERIASVSLTAALVLAIQVSLVRRGNPSQSWLWVSATAYVLLIVAQRLTPDGVPLTVADPWPFSFGCVAFGCVAIGTASPRRAMLGCLLVICGPIVLYAGALPVDFTAVAVAGLIGMSIFLVLAVTALRNRADWADAAQRASDLLFQQTQSDIAVEAERVRTDALIHDTVLAALLAASAEHGGEQVKAMATAALEIVTDTAPRLMPTSVDVRFGDVVDDESAQLAALLGTAPNGLAAVADVRLPENIAAALLGATHQALVNSRAHAGADAVCSLTAKASDDGGVQIVVMDDGVGFDPAVTPTQRLGVRVSILERVRDAGGTALVTSAPGRGTTVTLGWRPDPRPMRSISSPSGGVRIVSRGLLRGVLAVLIGGAVLMAAIENAVTYRAHGPAVAIILGLAVLPVLLRGAKSGSLRARTAWIIAGIGGIIIVCGPLGLDPAQQTSVSIAWYTCGIIAGAVLLRMAGHRVPAITALGALLVYVAVWAGPVGVIRLGLGGEIVLLSAGLVLNHAIGRVNRITHEATLREHELTVWQAQTDAYNSERRRRLLRAGRDAAPTLRQIVEHNGVVTPALRADCRVLEQALRDEIRGRALLNDAVRRTVRWHRQRGATVQLLDDGGLDDLSRADIAPLLQQVSDSIRPLTSSRIIIRTGKPDTGTAITIVASTPDETAAALGLDADDTIDLWSIIPRPNTYYPSDNSLIENGSLQNASDEDWAVIAAFGRHRSEEKTQRSA